METPSYKSDPKFGYQVTISNIFPYEAILIYTQNIRFYGELTVIKLKKPYYNLLFFENFMSTVELYT